MSASSRIPRRPIGIAVACFSLLASLFALPPNVDARSVAYADYDGRFGIPYSGLSGSNEDDDIVIVRGSRTGAIVYRDRGGIEARAQCRQLSRTRARCPFIGGSPWVRGNKGDDAIRVGRRSNVSFAIDGGRGDDRLLSLSRVSYVSGGPGADILIGSSEQDYLFGDEGRDLLRAGDGRDRLVGGAQPDRLYAGAGNDRIFNLEPGRDELVSCGPGRDLVLIARGKPKPPADCDRYGIVRSPGT